MKAPFCLVTCADREILPELKMLVASFRRYNPGMPILCVGYGLEADCKQLEIHWRAYAEKWEFKTDCGAKRCLALREGLKLAECALYADCDVTFTGAINPAEIPDAEVVLSRHFISADMERQFGKYNSGYVATRSEKFCAWWPEFTKAHPELFFEQKPLEHAPEYFKCAEFNERHNLGWWQYDYDPQRYKRNLESEPISIHGHLWQTPNVKGGVGQNWRPEWVALVDAWIRRNAGVKRRIVVYVLRYQTANDEKHNQELQKCLENNCNLKCADKIVVVEETKGRQNMNDVFELARKEPPGTICSTINADCFFDETLGRLRGIELTGKFLVFTRITHAGMLEPDCQGCQDAWAWLSDETPRDWEPLEFGRGGVDNRLVYVAIQSGFKVENRSDLVRVKHLHAVNRANSPGRWPSYPHPHGYVWPGPDGRTWIALRPGDSPPEQRGSRYPRQMQGRRANGSLFVKTMPDLSLQPARPIELAGGAGEPSAQGQ